MIKEIKIENFKSIQSLNLELGRLNVFIGANGSGKSNILEGIALGAVTAARKLDNTVLSSRGLRVPEIESFKPGFLNGTLSEDIVVKFFNQNDEHITAVISIKNKNWQGHAYFKTKNDSTELASYVTNLFQYMKFESEEDLNEFKISRGIEDFLNEQEQTLKEWTISDFLIFAPENSVLRNFREEGQILPLSFRGEGLFKHLVELSKKDSNFLNKINDKLQLLDWFEGFEIPNDLMFTERRIKIKDQFLEDGVQYIDQRSANEGFLYLLFYLTLFISDETPKFFAIDNIDNAMNPKMGSELIRVLTKLAKEHNKQTILTTHNPSVLDGLDLSDDEQRLFVISRNKSGHTQAIRVPYKESDERLSTRFIRGAIGGLPKNF